MGDDFAAFDTNGDGAVDQEELQAGLAQRFGATPADAATLTAAVLNEFDDNGDGRLSPDEFGALFGAPSSANAAAESNPWRPANLPNLRPEDIKALSIGQYVQSQTRDGPEGSGFVVHDVKGSAAAVWSLLTDYERYSEVIGTVRRSRVRAGSTRQCARASFTLSKFLLEVSVLHLFHSDRQHLTFSLDPASANLVLKRAEGMWFVETAAEGLRAGHVRVWFGASVRVSRLVPSLVVNYAAGRALRRATTWLRPAVAEAPLTLAQAAAAPDPEPANPSASMALPPVNWVFETAD